MENIINMLSNISSELIASILTLILVNLYNRYKNTKTQNPNSEKPAKRDMILRLARYFAMLVVLALTVAFVEPNKFFIVFIAFIFSIVTVMFIYDYTIGFFYKLVLTNEKMGQQKICARLLKTLINLDRSEKEQRKKIISRLKENNCKPNWDELV